MTISTSIPCPDALQRSPDGEVQGGGSTGHRTRRSRSCSRRKRPDRRWLYDLSADATEQNDLSGQRPEKTAELMAVLDGFNAEVQPPAWPALVEGVIPIDRPLGVEPVPGEELCTGRIEVAHGAQLRAAPPGHQAARRRSVRTAVHAPSCRRSRHVSGGRVMGCIRSAP